MFEVDNVGQLFMLTGIGLLSSVLFYLAFARIRSGRQRAHFRRMIEEADATLKKVVRAPNA